MSEHIEQIYLVAVKLSAPSGTPAATAEWQGWGSSYLKGYLESKLPAGSPYTVQVVRKGDLS